MNANIRVIFLFLAAIFLLPVSVPAAADRFAAGDEKRVVERQKRFMQRAVDDLAASRKRVEEAISALERQRSAIALLEAPQREDDLSGLLDWYYRYYDWLTAEEDAAGSDLARLSAPGALSETEVGRFREMADRVAALSQQLHERVKGYAAERDRLAAIIHRRSLLQAQFRDLEAQLARQGRGEPERSHRPAKGKKRDEKYLQADIRVVQTELLSLPEINEDILKHFTVLIEQGRWEREWLDLTVQEYDALQEVASLLPADDIDAMAQAYRRLVRAYTREIGQLTRMSGELDRKDSRLSPAGTIRQMDRTRDLIDLYDRLQQRFDARIAELGIRIGDCEAEVAELKSLQR